jgi:hypothetical protein
VTPANWTQGDDVMIHNSVPDDQARVIFGEWKAVKPYIRIVPQPRSPGPEECGDEFCSPGRRGTALAAASALAPDHPAQSVTALLSRHYRV